MIQFSPCESSDGVAQSLPTEQQLRLNELYSKVSYYFPQEETIYAASFALALSQGMSSADAKAVALKAILAHREPY